MMRGMFLILLSSVLALGCNYRKQSDVQPPVEVPDSYTEGSEITVPPENGADAPPESKTTSNVEAVRDVRWWRHMGDPTLTALIEEALRRNQSVRAGWARVQQARYIANQVRAARMPQIVASGRLQRRQELLSHLARSTSLSAATGSLPVSYEVDLFARRAREHQGAKLDAEAARLDQESLCHRDLGRSRRSLVRLDQLRGSKSRSSQEQLETDLRFLELVELRYREGLNSAVDVHQQRQRVASQRALLAIVGRAD